jgi:hypothetical protein
MKFHTLAVLVIFAVLSATLDSAALAQSAPAKTKSAVTRGYEARLIRLREQFARAEENVSKLAAERERLFEKLRAKNVNEASFSDVLRLLQTERVQLIIDLAGLDARKDAIVDLQQKNQSEGDQEKLLKQIMQQMESNLARAEKLYDGNLLSAQGLQEARVSVLKAKLRYAETAKNRQADENVELLTRITIEQTEKRAQLATIEQLLEQYQQSRTTVDALRHLEKQYESGIELRWDIWNELRNAELDTKMLEQKD